MTSRVSRRNRPIGTTTARTDTIGRLTQPSCEVESIHALDNRPIARYVPRHVTSSSLSFSPDTRAYATNRSGRVSAARGMHRTCHCRRAGLSNRIGCTYSVTHATNQHRQYSRTGYTRGAALPVDGSPSNAAATDTTQAVSRGPTA